MNSQLYKLMNIKFLEPHMSADRVTDDKVLAFFGKCKEYSNIVTDSQKLQIASTHLAALSLILSHVEGLSRSSSCIVVDEWKPLTVSNFFGMFDGIPPRLIQNLEFVLSAFHHVLDLKVNLNQRLLLLQATQNEIPGIEYWNKCKAGTVKKFIGCGYQAPRKKESSKGRFDHCSRMFSWIVEAIHCCSLDLEKLRILPRLFKVPEPQVAQRLEGSRYDLMKGMITALDFMEANIFSPCRELTEYVDGKIKMEQFLIMQMRKQSAKEDPANCAFKSYIVSSGDNWDYNFGMWHVASYKCNEMMRMCHSGQNIEAKALKLGASNIRDRFHYIGKCVTFIDVMETYLKYGCDPKLPDPPVEGRDNLSILRAYLE